MSSTSRRRDRVHVHLDHGRSLARWRRRHERGEVWEDSPYGYGDAGSSVDLTFSTDRAEGVVRRYARLGVYWVLGFDLVHAHRNRAALRRADVVWTHTEHEHLAVLCVVRTFPPADRPQVIAQSVWLWDGWDDMSTARRAVYRRLLQSAAIHTTLSTTNAERARRALPDAIVLTVPYGTTRIPQVAAAAGRPDDGERVRVVAPGNDRHRDWAVLTAAARAVPGLDVRILARSDALRGVPTAPNVTVEHCAAKADVLASYEWADVVVVPVRPNGHASGITVGIETLNAGRPLVISAGGGVEDYFDGVAQLPDPGDPEALALAILTAARTHDAAAAERGRRHVVDRGLTASDWVERHVALTSFLTGDRTSVDGVSAFAPASGAGVAAPS